MKTRINLLRKAAPRPAWGAALRAIDDALPPFIVTCVLGGAILHGCRCIDDSPKQPVRIDSADGLVVKRPAR